MSSIKTSRASHATHICLYKKLRSRILKCCASIYFNKQFLKHNLTPKHTKIKIAHTSPAAPHTHTPNRKYLNVVLGYYFIYDISLGYK